MKILLVSHLFPTKIAPFQASFIQERFKALTTFDKTSPSLIVPTPYSIPFTHRYKKNHSPLLNKGHRVQYLSFPKKQFPRIISNSISKSVLKFIGDKTFDIVHIHWLYPDGLIVPQVKRAGFKIVLTIHGSDWYQSQQDPLLIKLLEESLKKADFVLFSGPDLQKDILEEYSFLKHKSDTINNFVDTSTFFESKTSKSDQKLMLGWKPDRISALTVANLRPEKGIDLLIEAIVENPDLRDVDFHLVSNLENTKFSLDIQKKISQNKFQNIFIHSPVPHSELQKFYSAADLYISPSRREGFGLAMIEALFCGTPFLASNVGIAPYAESLGFGKTLTSELIPELSLTDIKSTIENITIDKNILLQTFSTAAYLKNIERVYKKLFI